MQFMVIKGQVDNQPIYKTLDTANHADFTESSKSQNK